MSHFCPITLNINSPVKYNGSKGMNPYNEVEFEIKTQQDKDRLYLEVYFLTHGREPPFEKWTAENFEEEAEADFKLEYSLMSNRDKDAIDLDSIKFE